MKKLSIAVALLFPVVAIATTQIVTDIPGAVRIFTKAALPSVPSGLGQVAKLSDTNKGLWYSNGSAWSPMDAEQIYNPVDFGADPTGVSDSSTAINNMIVGMSPINFDAQGYTIKFPPGTYKLSAPIDIVRRLTMTCSTVTTNGTPPCALKPDIGVTAIIVHFANDGSPDGGEGAGSKIENLAVLGTLAAAWSASTTTTLNSFVQPDQYSHYVMKATGVSSDAKTGGSQPVWSTVDYGGGTPVGTTISDNHVTWTYNYSPGIYCRGYCHLSYITIDNISGDAFAVVADTGNTPPTNANGSSVDHLYIQNANGSGVYIKGGDTNAGDFRDIDVEGNVYGWGIWDGSFLGNKHTAHQVSSSVAIGAYYSSSPDSVSIFDDCYSEGGTPASKVLFPAQMLGGFASQNITSDSTGLVISANTVETSLGFVNSANSVGAQLGNTSAGTIFSITPNGGLPYGFKYGAPTTGWWAMQYAAAANAFAFNDNTSTPTYGRFWVPNGIYVGSNGSTTPGPFFTPGTTAPVSGTYVTGDIVINQTPTAGAPLGWRCTAGGTPGTWVAIFVDSDAATGVTAAGTNQATCTQLVSVKSNVTTVAAGTGVCLPVAYAGSHFIVHTSGVNSLLIYANVAGGTLNGQGASSGITLANVAGATPGTKIIDCYSSTLCYAGVSVPDANTP